MFLTKDISVEGIISLHHYATFGMTKCPTTGDPIPMSWISFLGLCGQKNCMVGITIPATEFTSPSTIAPKYSEEDLIAEFGALIDAKGGWEEVDLDGTVWSIATAHSESPWYLIPAALYPYGHHLKITSEVYSRSAVEISCSTVDAPRLTERLVQYGFVPDLIYQISPDRGTSYPIKYKECIPND